MKTISLSANSSWYLYNFRSSTISAAVNKGYKVICISPKDDYSNKLIDIGCEHYPLNFSSKSSNPFKEFFLIINFLIAYLNIKPDVVFHFTVKNNIYGTLAAKMLGIPSVNNISGLGTAFIKKSYLSRIVIFLYKISQKYAFKIFCQNKEDYEFLIGNKIVARNQLILIPGSGVNTKKFFFTDYNDHFSKLRDKNFTFLYIGRMLYDKGLQELVDAFQSIDNYPMKYRLILCGFSDSDNLSAVSNEDIELWSNIPGIEWIGPTDNAKNVMSLAHCVVLPSYREGMPKSLLEAGSMGIPVIATNVPGCRDIITDGFNGFLCEPYSSNSLKDCMEKVLNLDSENLKKVGQNARKIVLKNFDEEIVVKNFFDIFNLL